MAAPVLTDRDVLLMGIVADAAAFAYFAIRFYLEVAVKRRVGQQQRDLQEEQGRWEAWRAEQRYKP